MHNAVVKAKQAADLENRNRFINSNDKAPTTEYARVGGILYRVKKQLGPKSDKNPLGIEYEEVTDEKDKTTIQATKTFDDFEKFMKGISEEILGKDAKSDGLPNGAFVELRVPNYSLWGPKYYTVRLTAEQYQNRLFANASALKFLEGAGVDTSGGPEKYESNEIYRGLQQQMETNPAFKNNMSTLSSAEVGTEALNMLIETTIKGWEKEEPAPAEEAADKKAEREARNTANRSRAEKARAASNRVMRGDTKGLMVDVDLIELFEQRDALIESRRNAYMGAMNSLPPYLKSLMKHQSKDTLTARKTALGKSRSTLAGLIKDLAESNANKCGDFSGKDDQKNFDDAFETAGIAADAADATSATHSESADLSAANDALKSGCDNAANDAALEELKAHEKELNRILNKIDKLIKNPEIDVGLVLRESAGFVDLSNTVGRVNRKIRDKAAFNTLFAESEGR